MRGAAILLTAGLALPAQAADLTAQHRALTLEGAMQVLQAATARAEQLHAPSSIAVVDPSGLVLAMVRMDGARGIGNQLAEGKARSAALFEVPTETLEKTIAEGRAAAVTAGAVQMQGGVPIKSGGVQVGAIGVSGLQKDNDLLIAAAGVAAIQ